MIIAPLPDAFTQARAHRPDRHWFVPDNSGHYCLACNLPERNGRHAERG